MRRTRSADPGKCESSAKWNWTPLVFCIIPKFINGQSACVGVLGSGMEQAQDTIK